MYATKCKLTPSPFKNYCNCRERERAVEQWMETASMSSRGVDAAEREAQKARQASSRLESEVKRLSNSLADLNTSYR